MTVWLINLDSLILARRLILPLSPSLCLLNQLFDFHSFDTSQVQTVFNWRNLHIIFFRGGPEQWMIYGFALYELHIDFQPNARRHELVTNQQIRFLTVWTCWRLYKNISSNFHSNAGFARVFSRFSRPAASHNYQPHPFQSDIFILCFICIFQTLLAPFVKHKFRVFFSERFLCCCCIFTSHKLPSNFWREARANKKKLITNRSETECEIILHTRSKQTCDDVMVAVSNTFLMFLMFFRRNKSNVTICQCKITPESVCDSYNF